MQTVSNYQLIFLHIELSCQFNYILFWCDIQYTEYKSNKYMCVCVYMYALSDVSETFHVILNCLVTIDVLLILFLHRV